MQIRRITARGHTRAIQRGEVLYEQGVTDVPFFVVVSGELEIVRPLGPGAVETLVTVYGFGQFTGEVGTLSGRRTLFRLRATKPGKVIELDRQHMLALVQSDAELGQILMRAFILRRVELVAAGVGDVVLIGSTHSAGTLRAEYRRPQLKDLSRFEGAGIYYAATFVEAQLCGGEEVIVVGGGNAAGQAAVFLAETTKRVHMIVRSGGLVESMSRYLIRRIEETPTIVLRPHTEIVALEGGDHLESVRWQNSQTGKTEEHKISHVFVMTGADPNTHWLDGCVALDAKGFIKTGPDLSPENLSAARWPLARPPYLLETSLPGVLAVGDVRGGSIKRVASAVGEGSIAISFVHRVLQE
jgi:thioredoxin reductase